MTWLRRSARVLGVTIRAIIPLSGRRKAAKSNAGVNNGDTSAIDDFACTVWARKWLLTHSRDETNTELIMEILQPSSI